MADTAGASRLRGDSRPDRRTLLSVCAVVTAAFVLDTAVVFRALATVLSTMCGQDWAWLVALVAGGVASLAATVAVSGVFWWWLQGAPPRGHDVWLRGLLVVTAAACLLAVAAALWLPRGQC